MPPSDLRQRFAALILGTLAAVAWIAAGDAASCGEETGPPNIVVMLADDLGYGDLGCYGHATFKTPALDRMAAEGVRMTDFYAPMPYCAPSRASLLTGRYPFRHGMWSNPCPDAGVNDLGIADSELLLSEALKAAGYATCCIGKWHLGHKPQFYPTRHGFDEYYGIPYSNDMRPVVLMEDEKIVEYPVVQCTLTKRYTDRALAFIERNRDRPFFLYLPEAMPHKPLAPSEGFYKKSGAGLYGDVIAELDFSIGRILAKLKELGLDRRTLVVFTSDNGPWFGGSTGGLRGMKGRSWDGGLRVPAIARWPGRIPAGQVSAAVAGIIDLMPTALAAAGAQPPPGLVLDGKSLLDVWTAGAPSPHEALFAMRGPRLAVIRSGRWKLHNELPGAWPMMKEGDKWIDPRGPDGVTILAPYEQCKPSQLPGVETGDAPAVPMLFDLEADAAEQHNVAAEHPEIVARLTAAFNAMLQQVPAELKRAPQPKSKANR